MFRILAFTAALALTAAAITPAVAQDRDPATMTVNGTGEVSVAPDMATLRIGVETRADSAAEAVAENNRSAQRIIETLKENGVEPEDVQTANFSVSPVYDETSYQRREGPRIIGYQATNQVVARIRDLDGLGALLDATVGSGANRIDSLEFGLQDDTEVADRARARAIEDARRKADVYAGAAGVRLGDIRSIDEGGNFRPMPMSDMRAAAPEAMAVPIERGQTTVRATVMVVWEMLPSMP